MTHPFEPGWGPNGEYLDACVRPVYRFELRQTLECGLPEDHSDHDDPRSSIR